MVEAASTAFILARRDGSDRAGQRFRFRSRIHFSFDFSLCRFLAPELMNERHLSLCHQSIWHGSLGSSHHVQVVDGLTRLQNAHGGLMPRCHAISIGDTNSNVGRSILEPCHLVRNRQKLKLKEKWIRLRNLNL